MEARSAWTQVDEENFLMDELGESYRTWVMRRRGRELAERIMRRAHRAWRV